jgi:hypothetical protein
MLVADSYYLDETSCYHLLELDIGFICAVQACYFEELVKLVAPIVKKLDKSTILMNEESGETFVHHWYKESKLGKKYVLTNILQRTAGNTPKAIVPGCDDYSLAFPTCDHYNRMLCDRTFSHCPSSDSLTLYDSSSPVYF